MGWTILSFGQYFVKRLCRLNHVFFWSKFSEETIWVEPYCFFVKTFEKENNGWTVLFKPFLEDYLDWTVLSFDEIIVKRQYGLNRLVFWSKFFKKTICIELHYLLVKIFLKRPYELNHIVFSSKFFEKTILVEPYCILVKTFEKHSMGWSHCLFIKVL